MTANQLRPMVMCRMKPGGDHTSIQPIRAIAREAPDDQRKPDARDQREQAAGSRLPSRAIAAARASRNVTNTCGAKKNHQPENENSESPCYKLRMRRGSLQVSVPEQCEQREAAFASSDET